MPEQIGLVLGSGGARGWAHLGVIEELLTVGIEPKLVVGASIGSLVGAFYAADKLDELAKFAHGINLTTMAGYFDLNFLRGGLIAGDKVGDWLEETFGDINIEDLPIRFGCVAADISTGREVWLRKGPLVPALRASTALPGLFPSVGYEGRWLSDGGLANPVPVSLARSMGADFVIAVDLDSEMTPYDPPMNNHPGAQVSDDKPSRSWVDRMTNSLPDAVRSRAADLVEAVRQPSDKGPGYLELVTRSLHIMMHRITRSRLAGDPPEALILPRLEGIGVLEFSRAVDAEAEGRQAVHRARPALFDLMRRHDGSGAGEDAHTPIDIGEVR